LERKRKGKGKGKERERERLTTLKLAMVKVAEHAHNLPIQKIMQKKMWVIHHNVVDRTLKLNRHPRLIERRMGIALNSIKRASVGLGISANSCM